MNLIKRYAIVVAGGSGTRMNADVPKQYLELNELPLVMHSIQAFYAYDNTIEIILVLPKDDFSYWKALCKQHTFNIPLTLAEGGNTRFESVKNGLSKIVEEKGIVAVHDGARPLVSLRLITEAFKTAEKYGSAVASIGLKDSIRMVKGNKSQAVDRNEFRLIQTPQVFSLSLIKKAYEEAISNLFTDDASVVEASGFAIQLIEGDFANIKITTPEDLHIAECFLNSGIKR